MRLKKEGIRVGNSPGILRKENQGDFRGKGGAQGREGERDGIFLYEEEKRLAVLAGRVIT